LGGGTYHHQRVIPRSEKRTVRGGAKGNWSLSHAGEERELKYLATRMRTKSAKQILEKKREGRERGDFRRVGVWERGVPGGGTGKKPVKPRMLLGNREKKPGGKKRSGKNPIQINMSRKWKKKKVCRRHRTRKKKKKEEGKGRGEVKVGDVTRPLIIEKKCSKRGARGNGEVTNRLVPGTGGQEKRKVGGTGGRRGGGNLVSASMFRCAVKKGVDANGLIPGTRGENPIPEKDRTREAFWGGAGRKLNRAKGKKGGSRGSKSPQITWPPSLPDLKGFLGEGKKATKKGKRTEKGNILHQCF